MDFFRHTELLEGIVNQLIDEETVGVCFEMHRAIKLGYYDLLYPEDRLSFDFTIEFYSTMPCTITFFLQSRYRIALYFRGAKHLVFFAD